MNFLRVFGWILLISGVAIIIFSLRWTFLVSKGERQIPKLFVTQKEELIPKSQPKDIEEKIQKMVLEQFQKVLPKEEVSQLLNLIAFSFFIGIFIFGGAQLANLGIKILKK